MLLAVDIGNTNLHLGLFEGSRLLLEARVAAASCPSGQALAHTLQGHLAPYLGTRTLCGAAISSVVRGRAETAAQACRSLCRGPVLLAQADWDLGLAIEYRPPDHVGMDRLLAAAAAHAAVPAGTAAVVVDAGTAITVDAVTASGTYRGGLIMPGLRLGLAALHSGTSLLPLVEPAGDAPLVGQSTAACLQAGALHGQAAMVDGLYERVARWLGTPVEGVLTGGDAALLRPQLTHFPRWDPVLVLRGLCLAFERLRGGPS
ncbi:MAG: type III pantothenate kinase [Candidatus Latescibacterota bacterium]